MVTDPKNTSTHFNGGERAGYAPGPELAPELINIVLECRVVLQHLVFSGPAWVRSVPAGHVGFLDGPVAALGRTDALDRSASAIEGIHACRDFCGAGDSIRQPGCFSDAALPVTVVSFAPVPRTEWL